MGVARYPTHHYTLHSLLPVDRQLYDHNLLYEGVAKVVQNPYFKTVYVLHKMRTETPRLLGM